MLAVGEAAVDFKLPDTDGDLRALHEFHRFGALILLFLPTVHGFRARRQLRGLLRRYDRLVELSTELVVIAADALPDLRIYQIRRGLPFVFLADSGGAVAGACGVDLLAGASASMIVNQQGIVCFRHDAAGRGWRASARLLVACVEQLQHSQVGPVTLARDAEK